VEAGTVPTPEQAEKITNPNVWADEDAAAAAAPVVNANPATPTLAVVAGADAPDDRDQDLPDGPDEPDQGTAPPAPETLVPVETNPATPGPAAATEEIPPPAGPEVPAEEVPTGTVETVLEWVGDDAARARAALAVEQSRPKPRSTLLEELEDVAGAG